MKENRHRWLSTLLGLTFAGAFLYLTFRKTDGAALWDQIGDTGPGLTLLLVLLSWTLVFVRGVRWWWLLPKPRRTGEFLATQRALALGYGVNHVAPRVGELVRILTLKRQTGRDMGSVTATVVLDRFLLDFLVLVLLYAYAIYEFGHEIVIVFPELEHAFQIFLVATAVGIAGLSLLAVKPRLCRRWLAATGLPRIQWLWAKLDVLVERLSFGLSAVSRPGSLFRLLLFNLLVWGLALVFLRLGLSAFGIELAPTQLLLVFAVTNLGLLLPSPGGVGTIHYFMTLSLTQFLDIGETTAVAAATYTHGVGYIGTSFWAVFFWLWPVKAKAGEEPSR